MAEGGGVEPVSRSHVAKSALVGPQEAFSGLRWSLGAF